MSLFASLHFEEYSATAEPRPAYFRVLISRKAALALPPRVPASNASTNDSRRRPRSVSKFRGKRIVCRPGWLVAFTARTEIPRRRHPRGMPSKGAEEVCENGRNDLSSYPAQIFCVHLPTPPSRHRCSQSPKNRGEIRSKICGII